MNFLKLNLDIFKLNTEIINLYYYYNRNLKLILL